MSEYIYTDEDPAQPDPEEVEVELPYHSPEQLRSVGARPLCGCVNCDPNFRWDSDEGRQLKKVIEESIGKKVRIK